MNWREYAFHLLKQLLHICGCEACWSCGISRIRGRARDSVGEQQIAIFLLQHIQGISLSLQQLALYSVLFAHYPRYQHGTCQLQRQNEENELNRHEIILLKCFELTIEDGKHHAYANQDIAD